MISEFSGNIANAYDLTVIGGGINGVAVASEAASRGLSTLLVHSRDLASGASAPPVSLAAHNLQALSALDLFQLTNQLDEIKHLQYVAPHLIDLLPVQQLNGEMANHERTRLVQRIFKHLRNRSLSPSDSSSSAGYNIVARIKPARMVVSLALEAQQLGANIVTYHRVQSAERYEKHWGLTLESCQSPLRTYHVNSRWIVNCSGWLANDVLEQVLKVQTRAKATAEFRTQFFFRNPLKHDPTTRKIFKIRGNRLDFHVYHATDDILAFGPLKCDQEGYAECIDIQQEFLEAWNNTPELAQYARKLTGEDILYKRRGNIALIHDPCGNDDTPLTVPLLDIDNPGGKAVLMNIFGAEPILAQKTARQALDALQVFTGKKAHSERRKHPLPGGDIPTSSMADYLLKLTTAHPLLPAKLVHRLGRNYGQLANHILQGVTSEQDLGIHFGNMLYEREVEYLVENEWARCAEDILARRTFIYLSSDKKILQRLSDWFAERRNKKQDSATKSAEE